MDVTWAELALDFQEATHHPLGGYTGGESKAENPEDCHLERRARYFAAASDQLAKMCQTTLAGKGKERKQFYHAHSLRHLGFTGRLAGLPLKPKLVKHERTMETLFKTALEAEIHGEGTEKDVARK